MKKIRLRHGGHTLVDEEDYKFLSQWKWGIHAQLSRSNRYAMRAIRKKSGKHICIFMHRFIMNCPKNKQVDHINGNGLDNRKINLRICTKKQNLLNRRPNKKNKTGFKGVERINDNRWRSRIGKNKIKYHLGYFSTKEEAALTYDKKAKELFGEFAKLNFN